MITTPSSDVTAKRASMEEGFSVSPLMAPESIMVETAKRGPTIDLLASPMKKQKEEERYSDTHMPEIEERYSDTHMPDIDSDVDSYYGLNLEWNVDSYDGRQYESDPEVHELFSDEEEYEQYRHDMQKCIASKGFIYEPLSGDYPIKYLDELGYDNVPARVNLTNLANLCVKKLNRTEGKTVQLVEIVRVIDRGGATWKRYITFMARESLNGPLVEYQAKVATYPGNVKSPFPILCRPSPIHSI